MTENVYFVERSFCEDYFHPRKLIIYDNIHYRVFRVRKEMLLYNFILFSSISVLMYLFIYLILQCSFFFFLFKLGGQSHGIICYGK